jgi:Ca-activated chloride channel family protein
MNVKSFSIFILLALLASACAPAATPIAVSPKTSQPQAPASRAVQPVPTQAPAFNTSAPQATQALSYQPSVPQPTQVAPATQPGVQLLPGSVSPPIDNFFQGYGVNPFVDAREDHLSTFALDVDTASYTVMRSYIEQGNLPPAEAVRVEEYVNYFNQGYPNPENVAFGIYADGAPSPFQQDGTLILRFGVQGYQVPEWQRKPATLTFVIDVSGSMADGNRLEMVKQSLQYLVDRLRPDDTVGIVVYSTEARLLLPATSGSQRDVILSAIYSLRPEDSTNAEAGLRLGYSLAMQAYRSGTTNRVILCSDGVANVGQTGPEAIMAEVHGYVAEGITLTTVGVGMGNFNDVLLEQLADSGNGNYAYVDSVEEARRIFVDNLTSTLQVIALDAKIQVDFNQDTVARYRLIGYENRAVADQDFRNDSVDAGEIGAGHSATALYAVQLRPGAQGRIATVQLRWKDPDSHQVNEINGNFNTWDLAQRFEDTSPRYQLALVVMQYAEVLRRSPWAYNVSMDQVAIYAAQVARALGEDQSAVEFAALTSRADQIIVWDR